MRMKFILTEGRVVGIEWPNVSGKILAKVKVETAQGNNNAPGNFELTIWNDNTQAFRTLPIGSMICAAGYIKCRQVQLKDGREFQAQDWIVESVGVRETAPRQQNNPPQSQGYQDQSKQVWPSDQNQGGGWNV